MILATLVLAAAVRTYHPVPIASFAKIHHTHVCTTGKVAMVKREADGDIHIKVTDGKAFVVAEIIPRIPAPPPKLGASTTVCGIRRFDDELGHGWWEVHPVEEIR